jgi:protoporphyrinogen/coproporphyrinogen III oxidase
MSERSCLVIGAGVAGLVAARTLTKHGWTTRVVESAAQPGGRLQTLNVQGQRVDVGASFVASFYPTLLELTRELSLAKELSSFHQTAQVVRGGVPYDVWPADALLRGKLLRPLSKSRFPLMIIDLLINWRLLDATDLLKAERLDDELVARWAERLLGKEATRDFIAPLLRGLLYWEPDSTSRAVLMVMLKAALTQHGTQRFRLGMQQFVEALRLGTPIDLNTEVTQLRQDDKVFVASVISAGVERELTADAVVCAIPAPAAYKICGGLPSAPLEFLQSVSYSRTACAVYEIANGVRGVRPVTTQLFTPFEVAEIASINPQIGADGRPSDLVKVYLSDVGYGDWGHLADDEVDQSIRGRLARLGPIADWTEGSRLQQVVRWDHALPKFEVGSLRGLRAQRAAPRTPGFALAGDYMAGPYVEGAAVSGLVAAESICSDGVTASRQVTSERQSGA